MLQGTRDDQVHREIAKVCDQRGYRNNTLKTSTVLASRPLLIDDPRDPRRHFEFQFSFFLSLKIELTVQFLVPLRELTRSTLQRA